MFLWIKVTVQEKTFGDRTKAVQWNQVIILGQC